MSVRGTVVPASLDEGLVAAANFCDEEAGCRVDEDGPAAQALRMMARRLRRQAGRWSDVRRQEGSFARRTLGALREFLELTEDDEAVRVVGSGLHVVREETRRLFDEWNERLWNERLSDEWNEITSCTAPDAVGRLVDDEAVFREGYATGFDDGSDSGCGYEEDRAVREWLEARPSSSTRVGENDAAKVRRDAFERCVKIAVDAQAACGRGAYAEGYRDGLRYLEARVRALADASNEAADVAEGTEQQR